ncbi:MAG: SNF2-related protein [Spirochaetota bacterium]
MAENLFYRIHSRILLEKLTLKRNPTDYRAYIETFRETMIDANPHQIEVVVYALEKLEDGGCILADEVGLGKTIEAGLVIAQYRAQRRWNVLILVPTDLAGQWQNQLNDLFQLSPRIITSKLVADYRRQTKKNSANNLTAKLFPLDGIYIIGRELASGLECEKLLSKKDWDLIIVDEAHEIFANIYRRFNTLDGRYNPGSSESKRAGNLYYLLLKNPVLLLTATPLQNNILELWGLASYLSKKNYLGELHHFKSLFLERGEVALSKVDDLRYRMSNFLIRNLRKDAQIFMQYTFTNRICETLNFNMTDYEKNLYNDISNYFERDDSFAYNLPGGMTLKDERYASVRNLLKLHYRRLLGSSFAALKSGLETIAKRLENLAREGRPVPLLEEASYEDDFDDPATESIKETADTEESETRSPLIEEELRGIEKELNEIQDYIERAGKIETTSKDILLLDFLKKNVFTDSERFYSKAVIFTQSLASQRHLKDVFESNGFKDEVVLYSGSNRQADFEEALRLWEDEIGSSFNPQEKPTGKAAERQALIYLFRRKKKIFISTEAGAKGLNLQFANVVINYDLPWNPQRIEQRIGRCHRYGQEKDVLVINCINADNETEKRIYGILDEKLKLFKGMLDSSNDVLGSLSKAINFEVRINNLLNQVKTPDERLLFLKKFEEEIDEETKRLIDEKMVKTRDLINQLDPHVQTRLKKILEELPEYFSQYDKDLFTLLKHYGKIGSITILEEEKRDGNICFTLENQGEKRLCYIGKINDAITGAEHLNLKTPVVQDIMHTIYDSTESITGSIVFNYSMAEKKSGILQPFIGNSGVWYLYKVNFSGLEEEDKMYQLLVLLNNGAPVFLNDEEAAALLTIEFSPVVEEPHPVHPHAELSRLAEEKIEELVKKEKERMQNAQQPRIERKLYNLEIELKDYEQYLKKQEIELVDEVDALTKKIRDTFDNEAGRKLIKQREQKQKKLSEIRAGLAEFQRNYFQMYSKEETKILEKRFLDHKIQKIFSFNFSLQ